MIIFAPSETGGDEKRVAITPEIVVKLKKSGGDVVIERNAGAAASFSDKDYEGAGARITDKAAGYSGADVIFRINPPSADDIRHMKKGAVTLSFIYPYSNAALLGALAAAGVTSFALDMMPRISRAQSMDALSSMSSVAGYKAVLIAANHLKKFFPMLMTAAGTITPSRVFVIGAGVAGLQAIATAKRLGATVEAYDVRPAVKEQIESLGAKFVALPLETGQAEGAGGYAKAMGEEFYKKQRELLAEAMKNSDAVISTALIPGKKAPILVTADAVRKLRAGSVIVDIAAEQGGNCELTEPGKEVVKYGVMISGLRNIPSLMATHSSQLISRNLHAFYSHLFPKGALNLDMNDEITKGTLMTHNSSVVWSAPQYQPQPAGTN